MTNGTNLLDTEAAVEAVLAELRRLKTATEEIEGARADARTLADLARRIVEGTSALVATGQAVLRDLAAARAPERFDAIEKLARLAVETGEALLADLRGLDLGRRLDRLAGAVQHEADAMARRLDAVGQQADQAAKEGSLILRELRGLELERRLASLDEATAEALLRQKALAERLDALKLGERLDRIEQVQTASAGQVVNEFLRVERRLRQTRVLLAIVLAVVGIEAVLLVALLIRAG